MRVLILFLSILFISVCNTNTVEAGQTRNTQPNLKPLQVDVRWSGEFSTWYELEQYYNGVPKYSGAFGTYTHKHIPVAVEVNGDLFEVRTDNTEDTNFYIYAMKNGVSVKVHTIYNWDDPHTNASINLDHDGYVWIHIASRGLEHKFQSGKILKSQTPYELDFECVDGCLNINYEAYPQIHKTPWGMHLIYTKYTMGDLWEHHRRSWSRVNEEQTKLSKLSHYSVSGYDEITGRLCVAQNTLLNSNPDLRVNLSIICTNYTGDWFKIDGTPVDFNKLDESDRVVYETQLKGTFVYLKDIIFTEGKLRVLFTESTSPNPTIGGRDVKEWVEGVGVKRITNVAHNYSAGAYIVKGDETYIGVGKSNSQGYLSGNIAIYNYKYNLVANIYGEFSYLRRVFGGDGLAVMSRGDSTIESRGEHYYLSVE